MRLMVWDEQLAVFVREFKDRAGYFDKYTAQWPSGPVNLPEQQLRELSDHFHEVCRKQHAHVSVLQLELHLDQTWCAWDDALAGRLGHCTCFAGFGWACAEAMQTLSPSYSKTASCFEVALWWAEQKDLNVAGYKR